MCGGILYLLGWAHGKYASQLQSAQRLAQLAEVKDLIDLVPLLVAVEGTAWTEAPLDCELTTRPAVMAQVRLAGSYACLRIQREQQLTGTGTQVQEQQHRRRLIGGRELKDTQNLRTSRREARWHLKDGSTVRLPVIGGFSAAHLELEAAGMSPHEPLMPAGVQT